MLLFFTHESGQLASCYLSEKPIQTMILFQKLSHSRFPRSQIESILGSTFQAIGIDNNKWCRTKLRYNI